AEDSNKDISIYIISPGGSITAGMAIFYTMQFIKLDVSTICTGMAASMGAFLLSAVENGKRFALPNSDVMIHQPSGFTQIQASDFKSHAKRIIEMREKINQLLADHSGQPLEVIQADTDRDNFMSANKAVEYGLIDRVLERKEEEKSIFKKASCLGGKLFYLNKEILL